MKKLLLYVIVISAFLIVILSRNCSFRKNLIEIVSQSNRSTDKKDENGESDFSFKDLLALDKYDWKPTEEEVETVKKYQAKLYGKVIDLDRNPVAGAAVHCVPNYDPWKSNGRAINLMTDSDGMFTVTEKNAPSLTVDVSAPGYYRTDQSTRSFYFLDFPQSAPNTLRNVSLLHTKTSKEDPAIFYLRKMASREPLVYRRQYVKLKDTQVVYLGQNEKHSITVDFFLNAESKRKNSIGGFPMYHWRVEFSVDGGKGGIIATAKPDSEDSSSFVAPEAGYQAILRYEYDDGVSENEYKRSVQTYAFVKFQDGTFALLEIFVDPEARRPKCSIASWFNPSGSRATEPDPSLYIK